MAGIVRGYNAGMSSQTPDTAVTPPPAPPNPEVAAFLAAWGEPVGDPSAPPEFPAGRTQQDDDFFWAQADPDVQRSYRGRFVAVSRQRVWGAGDSYWQAFEDARAKPGCPTLAELTPVYIDGVPWSPAPAGPA